jgi:hypothetical protein
MSLTLAMVAANNHHAGLEQERHLCIFHDRVPSIGHTLAV